MCANENEPVFHYTLHKKLWNILADNPGMTKRKALNKFFTEEERKEFRDSGCSACTYVSIFHNDDTTFCSHCPLDGSGVSADPLMKVSIGCFKGLFGAWCLTTDLLVLKNRITMCLKRDTDSLIQELGDYDSYEISIIVDNLGPVYDKRKIKELCSKYARAIANLPVKAGVKYI